LENVKITASKILSMKQQFEDNLRKFKADNNQSDFCLKAIFFDMDGVLYDSMPNHANAWCRAFEHAGLKIPDYEPYMNEGSISTYTVKTMFKKYLNKDATREEIDHIAAVKAQLMHALPPPPVMTKMNDLMHQVAKNNLGIWVVTGSSRKDFFNNLICDFDNLISKERMITAWDVKIGKPHPEPYLMAIKKSGYKKNEVMVVENAPLGVRSAKAAGLFTLAINTGPLDPKVLSDEGADIVLDSSMHLYQQFNNLIEVVSGN